MFTLSLDLLTLGCALCLDIGYFSWNLAETLAKVLAEALGLFTFGLGLVNLGCDVTETFGLALAVSLQGPALVLLAPALILLAPSFVLLAPALVLLAPAFSLLAPALAVALLAPALGLSAGDADNCSGNISPEHSSNEFLVLITSTDP